MTEAATPQGAAPQGEKTASRNKQQEKRLNARQLRFIDEYLVDLNASQAAIRSGYSKKAAKEIGYRLLTNAHIAAAIEAKRKELAHDTGITRERILRELGAIAFADVRKLFTGSGGMVDPTSIPDALAPAIASIELMSNTPPGEDAEPEYVKKVKLWDKPKALVELLKHLGMDGDRPPPAGGLGAALTLAGIDAFAAKLRERHGVAE